MKVFGKDVFTKRKVTELYDFAQHGLLNGVNDGPIEINQYIQWTGTGTNTVGVDTAAKKKAAERPNPEIKPKELYLLKALNKPDMGINCSPEFADKALDFLKDRKKR